MARKRDGRAKKRLARNSAFEKYAVTLPKKLEPQRRRAAMMEGAKPLARDEGPLSVRSASMIYRMMHGLKGTVKQLRGDMTQAAFAKRIGISQAALARMESHNNDVFPSTPLLIRIALVSGCDLQVSFLKRSRDASGPLTLSVETAGFPKSAVPKRDTLNASDPNEILAELGNNYESVLFSSERTEKAR